MIRYLIVSVVNGLVFGILDGIINANPYAQKMFQAYKPIAKTSINAPVGIIIDLLYGFIMGFIFLMLYKALPGNTGLAKGLSFALILWFFRVLMSVVSTWMTLTIPMNALFYTAVAGLAEMLIIGIIYGMLLKPFNM